MQRPFQKPQTGVLLSVPQGKRPREFPRPFFCANMGGQLLFHHFQPIAVCLYPYPISRFYGAGQHLFREPIGYLALQ